MPDALELVQHDAVKPSRTNGLICCHSPSAADLLHADDLAADSTRPPMCNSLKAKYFPNGELIDSVFTADASPSWKGIEHGLELLKKGLIWLIGVGDKVQIRRDHWIPRGSSLKVTGQACEISLKMGVPAV